MLYLESKHTQKTMQWCLRIAGFSVQIFLFVYFQALVPNPKPQTPSPISIPTPSVELYLGRERPMDELSSNLPWASDVCKECFKQESDFVVIWVRPEHGEEAGEGQGQSLVYGLLWARGQGLQTRQEVDEVWPTLGGSDVPGQAGEPGHGGPHTPSTPILLDLLVQLHLIHQKWENEKINNIQKFQKTKFGLQKEKYPNRSDLHGLLFKIFCFFWNI